MGIWSGKTTIQGGGPIAPRVAGGPWPAAREPFPNWNLTRDGIPYYGNHVACTKDKANVIAEEFAVLDRAGRLQLPRSHVEALELKNRVRLRLEEDHVGVWPDDPREETRK